MNKKISSRLKRESLVTSGRENKGKANRCHNLKSQKSDNTHLTLVKFKSFEEQTRFNSRCDGNTSVLECEKG